MKACQLPRMRRFLCAPGRALNNRALSELGMTMPCFDWRCQGLLFLEPPHAIQHEVRMPKLHKPFSLEQLSVKYIKRGCYEIL